MISILDEIEFSDAQFHKNMAIVPIKAPINYGIDVITLKKGFELGLVNVKECESSTVNTIIVENKSVAPLLLIDGEEIVGGDQNRIVNATVLIAPQSEMKIPVNCTEHGRWGFKHEFKHSNYMANSRTRSAKAYARMNMADEQNAVWNAIEELEVERKFSSPTQAMTESYENAKADLSEITSAFEIEKGQCGVVIIADGKVKGFEMFLNSDVYRQYHEKILKSYFIDTDINDSTFTISIEEIRDFLENALSSERKQSKNTGLEIRYDFKNDDGVGTLYTYKDELVHLSYFASKEDDSFKKPVGMDINHADDVIT